MKYIKPHLSPELRAQITPSNRRDVKLTAAGVFFFILSIIMVINLWPGGATSSLTNNKPAQSFAQTDTSPDSSIEKQVLGQTTAEVPEPEFTEYSVKSGDTLFNISQKYGIRWDLIAEVNALTEPYILHAGQALKIPQATTSALPNKIYTIKTGDTLARIAKQFNITVDDIVAVNPNLQKSDLITVGQVIKLP